MTIDNLCLEQGEKPIDIAYSLKAQDPYVRIDEMHIVNVFTNIVDNAVKYSPDNPKILISSYNQNGGIMVSFKDYGIGIKKESIPHIFEKFYRVHTGDLHDVKGFGLGLFYVKNIIEAHKGVVSVKSEPGKGSQFDLYIPYN